MLSYLSIHNLAIIEHLEIDFNAGFTALTGETGAGKSILIDALNLTLGSRSDLSLIRQGADKCEVSAIFNITKNKAAQAWLEAQEFDSSECIIRRQLSLNGHTKAMINGQAMGQKSLRELGELLVNIHSQHAHYALTQQNIQRQLLDDYSHHPELLKKLSSVHQTYQKLSQEYKAIQRLNSNQDKMDLLSFQLEELKDFNPLQDEYDELNQTHLLLSNTEEIKNDCKIALDALSHSQSEGTANSQQLIDIALNSLKKYHENYPRLKRATELLDDAQTYINEAIDDILHLQQSEDDETARAEQLYEIDQRLSRWHELARKHQIEPTQLYAFLIQLQAELAQLENASLHLSQLAEKIQQTKNRWQTIAHELSAQRHQKAIELQLSITAYLHHLQMNKARFEVAILPLSPLDDAESIEPTSHGQDTICFMFSANADISTRELSKIASGGELSRVALAIAVANADNATIPTLIFDEVDVGIGGATTEIVGQLLHQLGQAQQVLSITHQAQVASQANCHLYIAKTIQDDKTQTTVSILDNQQRIEEIARMIGGVKITDATRQHAREMLNHK